MMPAPVPLRSPALDALLLLAHARAAANASLDAALSRVGLWLDDLALLTALQEGPLDRAALAGRLSLPASETVRRLKPMEKLSWIERTDAGAFALTDTGAALVDEASGLAANRAEAWLGELLDGDEIAELGRLLRKLVA